MKVDWKELTLATTVAEGYGQAAKPVADIIRELVKSRTEILPTIVWVYNPEDEKGIKALEQKVFNDQKTGLALKRFICLKGNIETIPDASMARKMRRKAPVFYFFDPAGEVFAELSGKRAMSRSRFQAQVDKLWAASFDLKLRSFTKKMNDILGQIDKVESKKKVLTAKIARAQGKPGKLRSLNKSMDKIKKEEEKVLSAEQDLLASCKIKPAFLKDKGAPDSAQK